MVPLGSDTTSLPLLLHLREALDYRIQDELPQKGRVLQAFVAWISHPEYRDLIDTESLASRVAKHGIKSYQDVATLGYLTPCCQDESELGELFHGGLKWLMGRSFFVSHRTRGFEADATAMLGVAVGARKVNDSDLQERLNEVLGEAAAEFADSTWNRSLTLAAQSVLDDTDLPPEVLEQAPDLALAVSDLVPAPEEPRQEAWELVVSPTTVSAPWERLIVRSKALSKLYSHVASLSPDRASVSDVVTVLSRISDGLRNWTWEEKARTQSSEPEKWDVQHEYHVQNLLWAILRPIFPDLRDEEWLESIGHRNPRADLAIPSLSLVIEVKFVRSSSEFSEKIREVAAAAGMYVKEGSRFTQLVAFVWDDSKATEDHEQLRSGLTDLERVTDAVVVPRPGKWD